MGSVKAKESRNRFGTMGTTARSGFCYRGLFIGCVPIARCIGDVLDSGGGMFWVDSVRLLALLVSGLWGGGGVKSSQGKECARG